MRGTLGDFFVLRGSGDTLVAERPTPAEQGDLAYFLAAAKGAGPAVGEAAEASAGSPMGNPVPEDRQREAMAKQRGDVTAIATEARAYLRTLGWPGPIRGAEESGWAWGGARFSFVMRDLASADESLGAYEEAADLFRRANPGGGACGTSDAFRWEEQVEGLIRSEERLGQCRAIVPERMLGLDQDRAGIYGTRRLEEAGFDVPRLYRGALVTMGRDAKPDVLARVLTDPAALARLRARGPEAWERRVLALEGFADLGRRAALPVLLAAAQGSPDIAIRALGALGKLAERPASDPCRPACLLGISGTSGGWERPIRPLGEECATYLPPPEQAKLAKALLPLLSSPKAELRRAAAEALGKIGSPAALAALGGLARDPDATVRDAAKQSVESVRDHEAAARKGCH